MLRHTGRDWFDCALGSRRRHAVHRNRPVPFLWESGSVAYVAHTHKKASRVAPLGYDGSTGG